MRTGLQLYFYHVTYIINEFPNSSLDLLLNLLVYDKSNQETGKDTLYCARGDYTAREENLTFQNQGPSNVTVQLKNDTKN